MLPPPLMGQPSSTRLNHNMPEDGVVRKNVKFAHNNTTAETYATRLAGPVWSHATMEHNRPHALAHARRKCGENTATPHGAGDENDPAAHNRCRARMNNNATRVTGPVRIAAMLALLLFLCVASTTPGVGVLHMLPVAEAAGAGCTNSVASVRSQATSGFYGMYYPGYPVKGSQTPKNPSAMQACG